MKKTNIIFGGIFAILYIYGIFNSSDLSSYTNGDLYLLVQIISMYILLRMILTGFSMPINTFEAKKNQLGTLYNNGIEKKSLISCLENRIMIKVIQSILLNVGTIIIILSAWNLIVDIRNYFLICILVFLGTFYMLTIGNVCNLLIQVLGIKKEFILVFEMLMFISYNIFNHDNYLFPITIIMTQLSGVFLNDLLYASFKMNEILSYWPVWILLIFLCVMINHITRFLMEIIQTYDNYGRRENEE